MVESLSGLKDDQITIVVSDLKEGSEAFSLIPDKLEKPSASPFEGLIVKTARLIDYGSLYNEKNGTIIKLDDLRDPTIKAKHESNLNHLYFLKH